MAAYQTVSIQTREAEQLRHALDVHHNDRQRDAADQGLRPRARRHHDGLGTHRARGGVHRACADVRGACAKVHSDAVGILLDP